MTDILPVNDPVPAKKCCRKKRFFCAIGILVLILALGAAFALCPWFIRMHGNAASADLTDMQQRITTLESQVHELRSELSTHPQSSTTDTTTPVPAGDVQHMQSDISALTLALTNLQAEVKQTGSHAAESQQATQTSLATAIAYIQLRETAASGQSFSNELAIMRDASKGDTAFQEQIARLEPIAPNGAPTITTLHDELLMQERDAAIAIDKANAQNWWERILAELKTLVSVRKQHGAGATDAFANMENALSKSDVGSALSSFKTLPQEAQQNLADWRTKAEARQTTDTALRDMAAHFANAAATPAQGAP